MAAAAPMDPAHDLRLSYAEGVEGRGARALCRLIEALSGRRRLERLYRRYRREPHGEDFWDEALRRLRVRVELGGRGAEAIPPKGPLVVVANHPFGVIDGIAVAWAVGRRRRDVRVLAHDALARVPETRERLFTIDFSPTREAERRNARARAAALAHLRRGGALVVFPAGRVMTTAHALGRRAEDGPWGPLTARLALRSGATVLPVFVPGQNSRLFQIVSHISQTLRYALLFRETARRIGGRVELRIGAPIPPEALASGGDAQAVARDLRARTLSLAEPWTRPADPIEERWPPAARPFAPEAA